MATKYAGQNALNKLMSLIKNAILTKNSQLTNDSRFVKQGYFEAGDNLHVELNMFQDGEGDPEYKVKYSVTGMPKASTGTPLMDGTAAVGTSNAFARGDHVHPSDTAKVSKAGDTMTGTLTVEEGVTGKSFRIKKDGLQVDCMAVNGADATYLTLGETSGVDSIPVRIHGVAAPNSGEDAANKAYVDGKVSGFQTAADVQSAIAAAISGVYTPKGTIAFASLPTASAGNLGWVYNISDAFTTTAAFVEGAGKSYGAGTNVVCVDAGSGTYQWDVLAGAIDMTELTADEVQSIWDSI